METIHSFRRIYGDMPRARITSTRSGRAICTIYYGIASGRWRCSRGWFRKVHIITRRPQVPTWLDVSNPRVNVVHHDELSGFAPYLPTFNSTVIESFVHAVPGLADHFLYMNDDFLFGAPIVREDFLTAMGKQRVFGTYFGIWLPFRIYRERWKFFSTPQLEHCPRFVYKPFWEAMLGANQKALHRTRASRFPDRIGSTHGSAVPHVDARAGAGARQGG